MIQRKQFTLLAMSLLSISYQSVLATQHKQVYQSHEGYAKTVTDNRMQQSNFTTQKGSNFNDHYTENPNESSYGNAPEQMTTNAASAIDHSPYAKATHTGFNENPPFKINPNDPVYVESKFYMQNAKSLSHGTSDRYIDCQAQKKCRTAMVQHTCEKSQTAALACHKVATPHTKKVPYTVTVSYSGQLSSSTPTTGKIIPPESGTIIAATLQLENHGNNIYLCKRNYWGMIAGNKMSSVWPNCGGGAGGLAPFRINGVSIPVQAGIGVNFQLQCEAKWSLFGGGGSICSHHVAAYRPWKITMQVTRYKDESYITWSEVIC